MIGDVSINSTYACGGVEIQESLAYLNGSCWAAVENYTYYCNAPFNLFVSSTGDLYIEVYK